MTCAQVLLAKKKMRQLGCRTPGIYLDLPKGIIAKLVNGAQTEMAVYFGQGAQALRSSG
jgi:hypothetical protein